MVFLIKVNWSDSEIMSKNGKNKLVWEDGRGDLRKNQKPQPPVSTSFIENSIELKIRRLTSGKGRTVIEITGLPSDKEWCKNLTKDLKKSLGVGGTYKDKYIEIHGEKLDLVTTQLEKKNLKWKKTGG